MPEGMARYTLIFASLEVVRLAPSTSDSAGWFETRENPRISQAQIPAQLDVAHPASVTYGGQDGMSGR